jgi:putative drug exporter of the RND superfamily
MASISTLPRAREAGRLVNLVLLQRLPALFGLSMDYHVFILTRVREAFDRGMRTEDAVAHGIKSTAAWSRAQRS